MIAYKRGDVVLVAFVFSDESGLKHRPALVVSSPAYHRNRQDVIVAAITSNTDRVLFGDHVLTGWQEAGLLFPSLVTGILRTIKAAMIHQRLGTIPKTEMTAMNAALREILGLSNRG